MKRIENDGIYQLQKIEGIFKARPVYESSASYSFGGGKPVEKHVYSDISGYVVSIEKLVFTLGQKGKKPKKRTISSSYSNYDLEDLIDQIQEIDKDFDVRVIERDIEKCYSHYPKNKKGKIRMKMPSSIQEVQLKNGKLEPKYSSKDNARMSRGKFLAEKYLNRIIGSEYYDDGSEIGILLRARDSPSLRRQIDWKLIKKASFENNFLESIVELAKNNFINLTMKEQLKLKRYLFSHRRAPRLKELADKKVISLSKEEKAEIEKMYCQEYSYR